MYTHVELRRKFLSSRVFIRSLTLGFALESIFSCLLRRRFSEVSKLGVQMSKSSDFQKRKTLRCESVIPD